MTGLLYTTTKSVTTGHAAANQVAVDFSASSGGARLIGYGPSANVAGEVSLWGVGSAGGGNRVFEYLDCGNGGTGSCVNKVPIIADSVPSGRCTAVGWKFASDGHGYFCPSAGGTWIQKF